MISHELTNSENEIEVMIKGDLDYTLTSLQQMDQFNH